jgi:LuxR family maltose regulon positive regulatory protein
MTSVEQALLESMPTDTEAAPDLDVVPLISTKIQVPRRRPDLLPRRRLVDFFHAHLDRKLILISAPAGYGKTTLLSEFAHDTDLPVCWYTLDAFDQDLRVFLEYLIASISRRFPAFGARTRAFLSEIADPGSNLYPIVATLVREIYDTIPEYFVLILDDHHTVENQEPINELLDLFVTYADESCHLVLASRGLPALPNLSLLVAQRQAAGLSIDELRFTPNEIQALAEKYGSRLDRDQAEMLEQHTGGWITGILLTAVPRWEQGRPEIPLRGRISVDLYDYLSRQVLGQQPAPLRDFLLASSILDELSPDLCRSVLGVEEPLAFIDQVRRRNLFVVEYEGDQGRLRYHDLFREFLQTSLRRQNEARFRNLTRRAAEAYTDRGEWERAVSRYLALREYGVAAEIVDRTATRLYDIGRWDTLADWIDALPAAVREARPLLLLQRGKIHGERGQYTQALALLERAEQAFQESGDGASLALALAVRGSILRFQGRNSEALQISEQALSLVGAATAQEKKAAALATKNIGLCQLSQAQLADGRQTLQRALQLYEQLNDVANMAMVQHDLGLGHERAGDLEGAVAHYQAALQRWQQLGSPGPWANTLNGMGVIYCLQGQYDEAQPIFGEALTKAQQAGDLRVQAYAWASLGDLHRDLGAYEQAHEAYTQALEMARNAHVGFIVGYALDALGNVSRLQGNLAQARRQLLRAMEQAQASRSVYETAVCHASLGVLAGREGDLVAARRHLDQAVETFEARGFPQELSRACLHRAHVSFQAGLRDAALADLQRALDQAVLAGSDQFLVVEGEAMLSLLRFALKQGVGWDVLPGILQRIQAHRSRIAARRAVAVQAEPGPSLKIYALGQSRVELNGQSVQWPIAQSRDLFFCLLQHPGGLRKDKIGAKFWPDHAPQRLDGIFRSTLYRLRRALFRDSVLFVDDTYRFNRSSDYWYDAEAFEGLLDEARLPADPEKRITLLEDALALYRGDYLEGIYSDWPLLERERLRGRYLAGLDALAALYAAGGNPRRAGELYLRLLALDPYRETAHRALMRCYSLSGDRAAAIRQYQICAEILREDLGLSPTPETEALYLQIIG